MMSNQAIQKPEEGKVWDVVIIGSGPAGLTAAIYTTRGAASTLVLGGSRWGGQLMLTATVDNYPGFESGIQGPELMEKMKAQAERFGARFRAADVTKVDFSSGSPFKIYTEEEVFLTRSVIVATGASTVWLNVPGVKEFIGRGVSSCAPCDAPFFKQKKVIVVGGGDSAMEEALVLAKYASEVIIIHRRDEFRASKVMREKVLNNPKIKVLWNNEVEEIKGDDKVASIITRDNKTDEKSEMMVDGVFIAIGHRPESALFSGQLELDEKGFIKRENDKYPSAASVSGVFVAGDVSDYIYKQAITAAGFGCQAAMDALRFLDEAKD
jgi:thioredoxin reductase (NADPH)